MAVKKRNVWINDEDWAAMGQRAEAEGKTISILVRERVLAPPQGRALHPVPTGRAIHPVPKPSRRA